MYNDMICVHIVEFYFDFLSFTTIFSQGAMCEVVNGAGHTIRPLGCEGIQL